ncbi:hypothetical protein CTEN210_02505 [Chaetoceros tenuissimus]|uniref:Uncharacterized protein n=1 Tax=Chaetoceros tenuissimus TaxID=426638 RepID=A0AAD3CHN6_9STRA|nr:hypothetical protein CTEN210_02505 [Chaetoceros tenuissimus]
MSNDDYYYYRNKGFEDYIPTTIDPGPWMLIAVSIYSICCLIAIPLVVQLIRVCRWTNEKQLSSDSEDGMNSDGINSQECSSDRDNVQINMDASGVDAKRREKESNKEGVDDDEIQQINTSQQSKTNSPNSLTLQYFLEQTKSEFNSDAHSIPTDSPVASYLNELERKKKKLYSIRIKYNHNPQNINGGQENRKQIQKMDSCKEEKRSGFGKKFIEIIQYDQETKRILILGIPFMVSAVAVALFDAITLALVSKYLGVEALSAFIVTNVLLGLTDTLIKGVADALNTVCSHAIGADNYFLAGQYTQIALMIYVIGSVPLCVCWWFLMDDAIRLFEMNERVVEIGAQYTKVVMFDYMAVGMFDTFTALLDVSGYALPATIMDLAANSTDLLLVWLLLMFVEGIDLFWVGMAQMVSSVVIYAVFVCFVVCKGWIDPFKAGLVHSSGLKNIPAVKYVLKTAIPLSIGTLLEYGEWEALTFFAVVLGPAEVATWGILEAIWDLFEAFTEGLGEAGSIRLAFHLGKGNIDMAKLSAWKSLFISMCLALTVSALLFVLMPYIPGMFTDDETLQDMVHDALPLIGIGNILMVFGMVSWSLIGAQGRFKLATMVSAVMTFAVTLPLSAVSSIVYHFTLEGLVGAVVVGYSTTGLVLGCILQLSPWKRISKKIQDLNAAENEEESSSSDEESVNDYSSSSQSSYDD